MKKAIAVLAVFVLLCGGLTPTEVHAGGWGHHHHHGGGWGWFWPGAVIGGLIAGVAVAVTAPFTYAAPPPVVYQPAPPAYVQTPPYVQPAVYSAPAAYAAPPIQREVTYPHGKYVLYGNGVTQPWQWVWVPAPAPPAPPPPPPR